MQVLSQLADMQLMADSHFLEGFLKSWGMILASEIGDKTFFIAAIMAMKHPRLTVRRTPLDSGINMITWPVTCAADGPSVLGTLMGFLADSGLRCQVYAGAIAALSAMTVLSAVMGWAAPNLVRLEAWHQSHLTPALHLKAGHRT